MQHFTGTHVRTSALSPFYRRVPLVFLFVELVFPSLRFFHCVSTACLLLMKLFIMGHTEKTSAASFPASDSDFMPTRLRPGLTFEVLAFIRRGSPVKKVLRFKLSIYFSALALN